MTSSNTRIMKYKLKHLLTDNVPNLRMTKLIFRQQYIVRQLRKKERQDEVVKLIQIKTRSNDTVASTQKLLNESHYT